MFHPGALLVVWSAAVVALQALTLATLLAALGAVFLALDRDGRARWAKLARRSKWLLAVIVVTYVFATPGEAILPGYPFTHEGLIQGSEQLARFLAILGAVAWLLEALPTPRLIAGLLALARPIAGLGFDPRRAAARLVLVLEHVERDRFADWRSAFDETVEAPQRQIEIEMPRLGSRDAVLAGAAMAIAVLTVIS